MLFLNSTDPPSAILNTDVLLSLKLAIFPVLVLLLTTSVSVEPEVRFVIVVGPVTATVPAIDEPIFTLLVELAVALLPMLIVWVTAPLVLPT